MQDGLKAKLLRSSVDTFSFKSNCFLCGKPAANSRHPDRCQVNRVCTTEMHASMIALCKQRQDQWAFDVMGRLETCGDLFAADAVYHRNCQCAFSKVGSVSSLAWKIQMVLHLTVQSTLTYKPTLNVCVRCLKVVTVTVYID
jgi:hypothetical protein